MNSLEFLVRQLVDAIDQNSPNMKSTLSDLELYLRDQDIARSDHEGTIAAAKANYAGEDCQVHNQPLLDTADGGVWVEAWVWVPTKED